MIFCLIVPLFFHFLAICPLLEHHHLFTAFFLFVIFSLSFSCSSFSVPLTSPVPVFVRQGEVYFEWLGRLLCEDLGPEHR